MKSPPEAESAEAGVERPLHLLALSAKTEPALRELAGRYADHMAAHDEQPLAEVAFSANSGRSHFSHRLAVVAHDLASVRERLTSFVAGATTA